jgi:hypothetical protein
MSAWLKKNLCQKAVGMLLLLGSISCAASASSISNYPSNAIAFRYQRHDGALDTIGRHRGKLVLVSVFATWAQPALLEVPLYQALRAQHGPKNIVVIQLALDQELDAVRAFADAFEIKHLLGRPLDVSMFTSKDGPLGSINILPTSFLLGRAGRIKAVSVGTWNASVLARTIQGLLAADRSSH